MRWIFGTGREGGSATRLQSKTTALLAPNVFYLAAAVHNNVNYIHLNEGNAFVQNVLFCLLFDFLLLRVHKSYK